MNPPPVLPTHPWLYALACVLVPVLWGVAMVWSVNWLERRFRRTPPRAESADELPPETTLDYHI